MKVSTRCAPKRVITAMANYLDAMGYTVSKPERATYGEINGTWFIYAHTRGAAVRVHFDPKTCDYFVHDLAKSKESSIAREVERALRSVGRET